MKHWQIIGDEWTLLAAHGGVISHCDCSDVYTPQMELSTLTFLIIARLGHDYQLCAVLWGFKTSLNFVSNLHVALKACCLLLGRFHIIMLQSAGQCGRDRIYPGFILFAL